MNDELEVGLAVNDELFSPAKAPRQLTSRSS